MKSPFCIVLALSFLSCSLQNTDTPPSAIDDYPATIPIVQKENDDFRKSENGVLLKNRYGIWEMYLSGNAYQVGLSHGALGQDLMQKQEKVFFQKVEELVPKKGMQRFLRYFLHWYNRQIPRYVRSDFQAEIFGMSRYASEEYNWVAPKFKRALYLHGAHDIGHALQDLMLVGCSSLAVWGAHSEEADLLIGRNFDFYAGDDFAQDKVIAFIRPEKGIPYMSVSWAGMAGVVSGMNLQGLTVTMNAGKSQIPWRAKTPISLVAKEILQYASTIEEAIAIAQRQKVFVSESLMIGSAKDKKAILIELSPSAMGIFEVDNAGRLLCSNHFQSEAFAQDLRNTHWKQNGHSLYRWEKMQELTENEKLNPDKIASLLRNTDGLQGKNIGYGNEKSLNQLLAHHAVIFSPEKKIVWVSAPPYQLGKMLAFNLEEIFRAEKLPSQSRVLEALSIEKSAFLDTEDYRQYERFRALDRYMKHAIEHRLYVYEYLCKAYEQSNPHFWHVYAVLGEYYSVQKQFEKAQAYWSKALTMEISTTAERQKIERALRKIRLKRGGSYIL